MSTNVNQKILKEFTLFPHFQKLINDEIFFGNVILEKIRKLRENKRRILKVKQKRNEIRF